MRSQPGFGWGALGDRDMAGALTIGTAMALVVTLEGAVRVVCSLRRGWSGWPGQAGLRDAATGRKGQLESERSGDGEQKIRTWGRTGLPEGPLDLEPKAQPAPCQVPWDLGKLVHPWHSRGVLGAPPSPAGWGACILPTSSHPTARPPLPSPSCSLEGARKGIGFRGLGI